jgi:hypothetical protein
VSSAPTALANLTRSALIGLLLAAAVCGCGSGQKAAQNPAPASRINKPAKPAGALSRSLVSGVTQVKPGNNPLPLEVRFSLRAKPGLAQPVDVDIQIVPTAVNIDRISGKVEGEEGLDLVGSGELPEADRPVEKIPIERSVRVVPKRDGIYTLTATIAVESAGSVATQSYVFPVIAGAGLPDLPSKSAAAATASSAAPPATR